MMCDSLGAGIDPPLTEEPITDPDQGVKRNHSQGESPSSSDAGDMKKQKLECGDSKEGINPAQGIYVLTKVAPTLIALH